MNMTAISLPRDTANIAPIRAFRMGRGTSHPGQPAAMRPSRPREAVVTEPIPHGQAAAYALPALACSPYAVLKAAGNLNEWEDQLMRSFAVTLAAACTALAVGTSAFAQQPPAPPPYGEAINIEQAKKAAAGAVAEAKKNNWPMCIAVVAPSGDLVYFERMDNCQYASINIAQHKARAAARFRRPTLVFEQLLGKGAETIYLMTLDDMIGSRGGIPINVGGKIIGAIGTSGGTGAQDHQVSEAGVAALK
jgi:uncharacterized protein GlcG (DUF336 family)